MAERDQKGIDELTGQPEEEQPADSSQARPSLPKKTNPSSNTPRKPAPASNAGDGAGKPKAGVDVGGVPSQPLGSAPVASAGGAASAAAPKDSSPAASTGGETSPPATQPSRPVDTDAVGKPLPETVPPNSDGDSNPDAKDLRDPESGEDEGQTDDPEPDDSDEKSEDAEDRDADEDENERESDDGQKDDSPDSQEHDGGSSGRNLAKKVKAEEEVAEAAETAKKVGTAARVIGAFVSTWYVWVFLGVVVSALAISAIVVGGAAGATKDGKGPSASSDGPGNNNANCQKLSGTPKDVIDKVALPIAHEIAFKDITPQTVEAANAAHGPTIGGSISDHQGPPSVRWAADISNGASPTKEMDQLAKDLADCFGFPESQWQGNCNTATKDGYRIQLIYRTNCGGNHFNHVHIGVAKG